MYITGFLTWISFIDIFSLDDFGGIGLVPWFIYPVLLGIVGLFALLSLNYLKEIHKDNKIFIFIILAICTLILGKFISLMKINSFFIRYKERRFVSIIFSSTSILAPIGLINFIDKMKAHISIENKRYVFLFLVSLMIFTGTMSTFLSLSYWKQSMLQDSVSREEWDAISYLTASGQDEFIHGIFTVTSFSRKTSRLSSYPASVFDSERYFLFSSKFPDIPFSLMKRNNYDMYIYLNNRDKNALNTKYKDEYFTKHLFKYVPKVYNNSDVDIFKPPAYAFPVPNSPVALEIPTNMIEDNFLFAYDILSLGQYNFTTRLHSDIDNHQNKWIILPNDVKKTDLFMYYMDLIRSGKILIIINTNGYHLFGNDLIKPKNNSYDQVTSIVGSKGEIIFPKKINIQLLETNNATHIMGSYVGNLIEVPFLFQKNYGDGKIIYMNVFPIIQEILSNSDLKRSFYLILGQLFGIVDIDLPKVKGIFPIEKDVAFKKVLLNGSIEASSSSIIMFDQEGSGKVMNIIIDEGEIHSFNNVSWMRMMNVQNYWMAGQKMEISAGTGLYSAVTANQPNIKICGDNFELVLKDGEKMVNISVRSNAELFVNDDIRLYLRLPNFSLSGKITFEEFYGTMNVDDPFLKVREERSNGRELSVIGNVKFYLPLSDTYSLAADFKPEGSWKIEPALYQWDEWGTFVKATPLFFLILLIYIFKEIIKV